MPRWSLAHPLVHSNSRFESVRFDSLDESIRMDSVFQKIGPFDSITAWSLYAIFDCDCSVNATAAGTKAGKMSVKTSICPPPSPTFHHSTVECWPAELNRFESIFWCESNRIEIIFGELECSSIHCWRNALVACGAANILQAGRADVQRFKITAYALCSALGYLSQHIRARSGTRSLQTLCPSDRLTLANDHLAALCLQPEILRLSLSSTLTVCSYLNLG